jgi:hypothetical protein
MDIDRTQAITVEQLIKTAPRVIASVTDHPDYTEVTRLLLDLAIASLITQAAGCTQDEWFWLTGEIAQARKEET